MIVPGDGCIQIQMIKGKIMVKYIDPQIRVTLNPYTDPITNKKIYVANVVAWNKLDVSWYNTGCVVRAKSPTVAYTKCLSNWKKCFLEE